MFPVIALSQEATIIQFVAILQGVFPFLIASFSIGIGIFQSASRNDSQWRRNFRGPWNWPAWGYCLKRYRNCDVRRYYRRTRLPSDGVPGIAPARSEFSADPIRASGRPARMFRRVPIGLEQAAGPQLSR
jgi:hypothetical protein